MAYLMLVGTGGWTQRWEVAADQEQAVAAELRQHVGAGGTGQLQLLDPETDTEVSFVVAWAQVAAGVLVPSTAHAPSHGQYA